MEIALQYVDVTQPLIQGVSVAVLKGAVLYGLDPCIVHVRRAARTYGIGIVKPFAKGKHPKGEMLDVFVYHTVWPHLPASPGLRGPVWTTHEPTAQYWPAENIEETWPKFP